MSSSFQTPAPGPYKYLSLQPSSRVGQRQVLPRAPASRARCAGADAQLLRVGLQRSGALLLAAWVRWRMVLIAVVAIAIVHVVKLSPQPHFPAASCGIAY